MRNLVDLKYEDKEVSEYFKKYVRKGEEKVATMFEAYLHAPELFKQTAPTLYKEFTDFLKNNADTKPILDIRPSMVYGEDSLGGKVDKSVFKDKNGKKWNIEEATTKEIEGNTNLKYPMASITF